jgi:hypothetical protein
MAELHSDGRVHVLRRGPRERRCEARRTREGFELIITIDGAGHVEPFSSLAALLARERALLRAWRAHGWRDVGRE